MTRTISLLGLALGASLTASCALFQKPEPVVTTVIQTVDRPVIAPCLKLGQRPVRPKLLVEDQPTSPETLTEMVGRFRAKLKEWVGYGQTADELMAICEKVPEPKPVAP